MSPLVLGQVSSTVNCPECRAGKGGGKSPKGYSPKTVSPEGRKCTVRFATGGKCGKPAVYAFKSSTGEIFAECREHHG
jgi:hypothetical protein